MKTLTSISKHSDWLDSIDIVILDKWNLHRKRVNFGKQPLAIYQFIPCKLIDGEWVVLEEPNPNKFTMDNIQSFDIFREQLSYYQEALDKVLFEGFEKVFEDDFKTVYSYNELHICFGSKNIYLGKLKDNRIYNKGILTTIEDLAPYNLPLTKTALKEIGL